MTKAGVWLRVSTDQQTASNQVPDVDRFTAHHGYEVAERYEISESAWNGGKEGGEYRKTLQQVLDDAWAGKFSVLVVWSLDRITREGAEGALRIIRQLRERGCILVSIKESWLNGAPEIQDVLVAFAGWQAQMESQRRSDRIRAGMARRKAEGKPQGGRPEGTKDSKPRRTDGYKATWSEGGTRREAAKARERTFTCRNRECLKEFTSTAPNGAQYCSLNCANAVRAFHRGTEGARLALQVLAGAPGLLAPEQERLARARAADEDESWSEVAGSLGMARDEAVTMYRLMMIRVTGRQRETQAAQQDAAERDAAVQDALAVLSGAGIKGAEALVAQHQQDEP